MELKNRDDKSPSTSRCSNRILNSKKLHHLPKTNSEPNNTIIPAFFFREPKGEAHTNDLVEFRWNLYKL